MLFLWCPFHNIPFYQCHPSREPGQQWGRGLVQAQSASGPDSDWQVLSSMLAPELCGLVLAGRFGGKLWVGLRARLKGLAGLQVRSLFLLFRRAVCADESAHIILKAMKVF